jgi:WD40 repeat protein
MWPISLAVHPSQPYVMLCCRYNQEVMKLWNWDKGWECTRTFQISGESISRIYFDPKETNRFAAVAVEDDYGTAGYVTVCMHGTIVLQLILTIYFTR